MSREQELHVLPSEKPREERILPAVLQDWQRELLDLHRLWVRTEGSPYIVSRLWKDVHVGRVLPWLKNYVSPQMITFWGVSWLGGYLYL